MKLYFIIFFSLGFLFLEANAQQSNQYSKTNKTLKERYGNLIGMKVKEVLKTLNLDTSQFFAEQEPPMVISSLFAEVGDTLEIHFYVERTGLFGKPNLSSRQEYKYIENKKVKGISIYNKSTKLTYNLKN